jgi:putative addiction module component (TIGR02574 family)
VIDLLGLAALVPSGAKAQAAGILAAEEAMTNRTEELLAEVLKLPLQERAALAAEVLASMDGEVDADVEAAWLAEIERRGRRVLAGESQGIPWEQVSARIEKRLRSQ